VTVNHPPQTPGAATFALFEDAAAAWNRSDRTATA
jgi:hypothetical protein